MSKPSVADLMQQIAMLDTYPAIYRVNLRSTPHMEGFSVDIDFRANDSGFTGLAYSGTTPEEVLQIVLEEATRHFGKCSACGNYKKS